MSRLGPNALKANLNDLKKLNTSSMAINGSFENINKKDCEISEKNIKTGKNAESKKHPKQSGIEEIQIKLGHSEKEKKDTTKDFEEIKKGEEGKNIKGVIGNNKKSKDKKSRQVIFNSQNDKIITVDNWKKYNIDKQKFCKCSLI